MPLSALATPEAPNSKYANCPVPRPKPAVQRGGIRAVAIATPGITEDNHGIGNGRLVETVERIQRERKAELTHSIQILLIEFVEEPHAFVGFGHP